VCQIHRDDIVSAETAGGAVAMDFHFPVKIFRQFYQENGRIFARTPCPSTPVRSIIPVFCFVFPFFRVEFCRRKQDPVLLFPGYSKLQIRYNFYLSFLCSFLPDMLLFSQENTRRCVITGL
jgi:hypothetical protein